MIEIESLKAKKQEANRVYRRALLLRGHTAGKNCLFEATSLYYEILNQIEQMSYEKSNSSSILLLDLKKSLLLNLAACSLELKSFDSCLRCCDSVLEIDSLNEKALFRKASSLINLQKYVEASDTLKACLEVNPKNGAASRALRECQKYLKNDKVCMATQQSNAKYSWKINSEFIKRNGLEYISNGAKIFVTDEKSSYLWGQTIVSLELIFIDKRLFTSKVKDINISRNKLSITFHDNSTFKRNFYRPIDVEQSVWQYEKDSLYNFNILHLTLQKAKYVDTEVIKWWKAIFIDDTPIDISKCRLPENSYKELPEDVKREWNKNVETDNKTISLEEQELIAKTKKEIEEREKRNKEVKDPKKKQFLKMMSENFPQIQVDLR